MVMSHMPQKQLEMLWLFLCQGLRVSGSGMDNSVMVGAGGEAMPYLKCLLPCLPALILQ